MGVVFRGGSSGDDHDYRVGSPGFDRQEIEDTANNSGMGPGVTFPSQNTGNSEGEMDPAVPKGGSNPITAGGDPGASGSDAAPADVFRGSKTTPGL